MGKNELQLSQHNCIQATPSKVGNNKSLALSNEGSGDENIGMAHSDSLKTHSERKARNKKLPWNLIPGEIRPTPKIEDSDFPRYIIVAKCLISSWLVAGWQQPCAFITGAVFNYQGNGEEPYQEQPTWKLISPIFKSGHNSFCFLVFSFQQQTECVLCFKWFLKLSTPSRAEAGCCLSIFPAESHLGNWPTPREEMPLWGAGGPC